MQQKSPPLTRENHPHLVAPTLGKQSDTKVSATYSATYRESRKTKSPAFARLDLVLTDSYYDAASSDVTPREPVLSICHTSGAGSSSKLLQVAVQVKLMLPATIA